MEASEIILAVSVGFTLVHPRPFKRREDFPLLASLLSRSSLFENIEDIDAAYVTSQLGYIRGSLGDEARGNILGLRLMVPLRKRNSSLDLAKSSTGLKERKVD